MIGRALQILALCVALSGAKAHAEPKTTAKPAPGGVVAGKPRDEAKKKTTAPAAAVRKPQPPRHRPPGEQKDETAPVENAPPKARLPVPAPPDTSAPPPRLPSASREKMRACAVEWTKLKMETRGPLPLWRDFAGECLTREKTRINP
jgi:hypothetical protein